MAEELMASCGCLFCDHGKKPVIVEGQAYHPAGQLFNAWMERCKRADLPKSDKR